MKGALTGPPFDNRNNNSNYNQQLSFVIIVRGCLHCEIFLMDLCLVQSFSKSIRLAQVSDDLIRVPLDVPSPEGLGNET